MDIRIISAAKYAFPESFSRQIAATRDTSKVLFESRIMDYPVKAVIGRKYLQIHTGFKLLNFGILQV